MLRDRRKASGLTQVQVADALERPHSFVVDVEAGARRVDLVELLNLAQVIGFDPAELVSELLAIPNE